ncbi:MAG: tRNA preQ1(34) S-adenosylmethionine ribosyltransferase-isomerase QueA [Verrucomicrobiales bacterium]
MRTDDFDYHLPEELIASRPPERRDASRMMLVDRAAGRIEHLRFADFPAQLREGDLCVLNNTRVLPARFFSDDGKKEIVRLDFADPLRWKCLVRPGRKMRIGDRVTVGGCEGEVAEVLDKGERLIAWDQEIDVATHGRLALPHYMGRESDPGDLERYQTVYADPAKAGAIAAPTAGLHFTPEILAGIPHAYLTLHVGVGTFQPVRAEQIEDHEMHREQYELSPETAARINAAQRVLAVGTTAGRVLEHCAGLAEGGPLQPGAGETGIFIYPGYRFLRTDALLTNFHLPKSTLFMLVCAMAGTDLMREAYAKAVEERYRFFSYGDCMLIE